MATLMTNRPPGVDPKKSQFDAEATTALDLIVHDPGRTSSGVVNWAQTPDVLTRFGLALPGQPNFVDYQKIKSMRNGTLTADGSNNAPDYPEVKNALGITNGDFHLRTYPVLPSMDDPHWTHETVGRVAYFGHYSGASSPAQITATSTKTSSTLNVSVTITNAGSAPAIYYADVSLGNSTTGSTLVPGDERNTYLLPPGASQTVWVSFDQMASWPAGTDGAHVLVTDGYGNIAVDTSDTQIGDLWVLNAPPVGSANTYELTLSAEAPYYVTGATVKFDADNYDVNGAHVGNVNARLVLLGPNNKEWQNFTFTWNTTNGKGNQAKGVFVLNCANCTTVGNYTAVLWNSAMNRRAQDVVYVAAAQMFTGKSTLDPIAQTEVTEIQALVSTTEFNPTRYDATANTAGDIFGDDTNGPSDIVPVLPRYQWLIVGSEVSQTALNPSQTKNAIADWVAAGGNLIVLGTYQSQSRWLEPIYHAMQANANGAISAPDPTNPILVTPEHLNYDKYLDRGRAWQIDTSEPFTHVLNRGTTGTSMDDTLTYANPGSLGNGTVVLTSYMPGSLTSPQDNVEAEHLLHNLMSQSYTMLFLDFGPSIPDGVAVGSDQRLVAIPHPNVPGAVVQVRIVMYVFG